MCAESQRVSHDRWWRAAGFATLFALSLVPRWAYLASADYTFSSDEAVDALVMKRAVERGEWRLFNWDTRYYGVFEGLGTLPLVPLLGFRPLAFKLGALLWLWVASLFLYRTARRRWGETAAWTAAALPVFFSAQLIYWSLLAAGGYLLVVAWGAAAFDRIARRAEGAQSEERLAAAFGLGLLLGLGLYAYRLFVVYLFVLGVWWLQRCLASRGFHPRRWFAASAGFAIGLIPALIGIVTAPAVGREPSIGLASSIQMLANLSLLGRQCLPALLGTPTDSNAWHFLVRDPLVFAQALGALAGWLALLVASLPRLFFVGPSPAGTRRFRPWPFEALVALLPLVNVALFVASRSPTDVLSNRYLLPSLVGFALGAAWLVAQVTRRSRRGGILLALALVLPGVAGALRAPFQSNFARLESGPGGGISELRLIRKAEPLDSVVAELERRGVGAAYAPYWVAYKATFLSTERLIVDPTDWSRFRPYADIVDRDPAPAWIFSVDPPGMDETRKRQAGEALARFETRLAAGGRDDAAEIVEVPHFRLFLGRAGAGRLLPPPARETPQPLAAPDLRGEIEFLDAPSRVEQGADFTVRARFTNRGRHAWLTEGDALRAGRWQVNLAYRWLRADGSVAVEYGGRTPLPWDLPAGATLDARISVRAPAEAGDLRLRLTLVQEDVAWFDQASGTLAERMVTVDSPDAD